MVQMSTETGEAVERRLTYRVAEERIDDARDLVAKVNKKAARYGLAGYTLTVGELQTEPLYLDPDTGKLGTRRPRPDAPEAGRRGFYDVEVTGEMPRFAGWSFVATIDLEEEVPITRLVPGVEVDLSAHRAEAGRCDYCNKNRERTATFVFRHDDGGTKQVGRSCLQPFAGIHSPAGLAWLDGDALDELRELDHDDREAGGSWTPSRFLVAEVLRYACAVEQLEGWRSRVVADEIGKPSTSSLTMTALSPSRNSHDQEWAAHVRDTADWDTARAKAAAVLAWAGEQDGTTEYAENLRALAGAETVTWRNTGLLISAIAGYNRAEGIKVERARAAKAEHVGEPKGKIRFTGEVALTRRIENTFGYRAPDRELVRILADVDGTPALLVWWSSSVTGLRVGDAVAGIATVKAHEVYGDANEQQTVIIRPKFD